MKISTPFCVLYGTAFVHAMAMAYLVSPAKGLTKRSQRLYFDTCCPAGQGASKVALVRGLLERSRSYCTGYLLASKKKEHTEAHETQ